MPDISMCAHAACPLRQSCYRHVESGTVPDSPHQWYGEFEPTWPATGPVHTFSDICSGYIEAAEPKP